MVQNGCTKVIEVQHVLLHQHHPTFDALGGGGGCGSDFVLATGESVDDVLKHPFSLFKQLLVQLALSPSLSKLKQSDL